MLCAWPKLLKTRFNPVGGWGWLKLKKHCKRKRYTFCKRWFSAQEQILTCLKSLPVPCPRAIQVYYNACTPYTNTGCEAVFQM